MTSSEQAGVPAPADDKPEPVLSLTVLIAFGANLLIAVAKTVAAVVTGAASMVAEAAHSWADTGNEVFLMVAERRSSRPADRTHPSGHGREAYVWSMMAAIGLFVAGATVSITHGIHELVDPEPASNFGVAYAVFAIALVLESISFAQAFRQMRRGARAANRDVLEHALRTSDPTLRAVFAEDFAAVVGIFIAATGVGLHQATGSAVPDAIGSIAVGVLLGIIAVVLFDRNRAFLVGVVASPERRDSVVAALEQHPEITKVTNLHLEFVGPRQLLLVATVDLTGDAPESEIGARLRRLEADAERRPSVVQAIFTVAATDEPALD